MANWNSNGVKPTNGLIRVLNVQQIIDAEAKAILKEEGPEMVVSEGALARHIRKIWERNKLHKERISQRLLACLRARRSVFSSAEISKLTINGGLNIIFDDLTETKCRAASSWIRDIVLPAGEQAWELEPSPMPDLPQEVKAAVLEASAQKAKQVMVQMMQSAGQVVSHDEFKGLVYEMHAEMHDEVMRTYRDTAEQAAERMEQTIAEDLQSGGWYDAMDDFIEDFVTYPTAFMKGPVLQRVTKLEWGPGWTPIVTNKPEMKWMSVSPFDIYPAPHSKTLQDGEMIERLRYQRENLYDCIGLQGFNEDQIRNALQAYSSGHLEAWLWTEAERRRLEEESLYEWLTPAGVIDALQFWGKVPGWMLLSWGMDPDVIDDPVKEYDVDAILVGAFVIRCALNTDPMRRRPYHSASYDSIPGALWGRSIPDLVMPHQKMCNAIAMATADNMAISSGPMAWVHVDRLADGVDSLDLGPWKMFQLKSDPSQGVNPGIGFFQAQSNVGELTQQYEQWSTRADDASGVPRYTYGDEKVGGAGNTASGLAMLMNSAAKGLRRAISAIDRGVIQPTLHQAYVLEMLHNQDKTIKCDAELVPRGAAAILIKDAAQKNRQMALQLTANPLDMQIIGMKGRAELLRETLKTLELPVDKIVPDDQAIQQMVQAQQEQGQQHEQAMQQAQLQQMQLMAQKEQVEQARTLAMTDPNKAKAEAAIAAAQIAADSRERVAGAEIAARFAEARHALAVQQPNFGKAGLSLGVNTPLDSAATGGNNAAGQRAPRVPEPSLATS